MQEERLKRETARLGPLTEAEAATYPPDPGEEMIRIDRDLRPKEQQVRKALTQRIGRELGHSVSE